MTKSAQGAGYLVRLTLTLFLITAIVAALLGGVNQLTAERIETLRAEKTRAAMAEVLAAEAYLPVETALAKALYEARSDGTRTGWVAQVAPAGFGGAIDRVVGIDADGQVTGGAIVSMTETSGLGDNARKESFRSQFVGLSGSAALTKDGGSVDALTGATITSRAVAAGVTQALAAAAAAGQ